MRGEGTEALLNALLIADIGIYFFVNPQMGVVKEMCIRDRGTAFGECGEGFLRISYAYSIDNLKKALDKIEKFIDTLN